MNTILVATSKKVLKGRILAIEPDPMRSRNLRELLGAHVDGHVEVVASTEGAMRCIGRQLPDVVLTSSFLPPSDEAALTEHLKSLPAAAHVQVIITPHFIDSQEAARPSRSPMFGLRARRPSQVRPACDPDTFIRQIEDYIQQAQTHARLANDQEFCAVLDTAPELSIASGKPETRLVKAVPADVEAVERTLRPPTTELGRGNARDRRRETRRQRQDLPRLWSARLSSGTELALVDLSKSGILVETTSRMTLGSTLDLQFVGQNTDISIPARVLRSDIAKVDGLGVKYRVAAQFKRDLDLLDYLTGASDSHTTPAALADVLARALADVERRSPSASLGRFEEELRNLLPVRAIQIRQSPLVSNDESICFDVPGGTGSPVLQATFHADNPPAAADLKLLKAAAHLAAVVLEYAPLPEK
jgi:hypothetical protein